MEYRVIGIMSGSSLDGLDVCLVRFFKDSHWQFEIEFSNTLTLPPEIKTQLNLSPTLPVLELHSLDMEYGGWIGNELLTMFKDFPNADLIAIHGHTVFHEPKLELSIQIGNGQKIAQITGIPVIDNFRTKDILLGGQGAPLVPFGESKLFPEFGLFLNLGGIANVSIHQQTVNAWDVAPCNQVFNYFSKKLGREYDAGGQLARSGSLNRDWLSYLEALDFFSKEPPKSLSNQWTQKVLEHHPSDPRDSLHTYCVFLAEQISRDLKQAQGKLMITGGGAYNDFFIETLKSILDKEIEIYLPKTKIIDFKEALVFAFLGLMRLLGEVNILCSVTGARRDSVSGILHQP
ncbi:MAG: anhydro-N-acetylmuramic acid kinase [Flavobacteriaceae bacterium]|jgi:anhydro-N-acetylmuramic acid kinase